jgi:hypothetical protein
MKQLGALGELAGSDDERHNPASRDRQRSGRDAVKAGLEIALAARANDLVGDLAFIEQQQGGNGANAVLGGERLVFVNVHFADFHLAIVFVGQLVEERRDHFARAAPLGPEIHEHGQWRLQNLLREIFLRERDDQRRSHTSNEMVLGTGNNAVKTGFS